MRNLMLSALISLIVGAVGGGWFFYERGKSAGEIASGKKLNEFYEGVLRDRANELSLTIEKFEEAKSENERLRKISRTFEKQSNDRRAALDIALNSLRVVNAASSSGSVPGASASATDPDATAAQCRSCAAELEAVTRRAAHDALTVLEWQKFYEDIRSGDFSEMSEKNGLSDRLTRDLNFAGGG
ncbi:MAG: hypothetical protein LBE32_05660 [Burkholderiales bacterium]|jgi:hypothetical protein|nr:hypothetical protein [Burkholderiales bacterium]